MAIFDEKKKECPAHYKYARCPKGTWCHWISELAVRFLFLFLILLPFALNLIS
jgi:hypothetical protein